ncbi:hypothetical protein GCM10025864_14350 [Luteimicrobium album]|uniref:Uncharacterized protein n=1 Tax=Luteimicrobium album TaxID=1054550 RepID=A0ABQ6HYZ1_9MICO|nr:hypothetical protein GCM10025864_14350 [Luteimicrobium album]
MADAHRVDVVLGPLVSAQLDRDVLLDDRPRRLDPPRLADVRLHGETVVCPADLGEEAQTGVPVAAVGPGSLGLKPVHERETELPRGVTVPVGTRAEHRPPV